MANLPEFLGFEFRCAVLVVTTDGKENGSLRPQGRRALDFEGRETTYRRAAAAAFF